MDTIPISDLTVLVVEPSITVARFIEGQLASLKVRHITSCSGGNEALTAMRRHVPDLVVSALYLPDMTATELIETMRRDPLLEDIPFMLVSTETSFAKLDGVRQAGVVAILPKPFAAAELRKALIASTRFIDGGPPKPESSFNHLKVLVVDDSFLARKHIGKVLNNLGIENIVEAENGREALAELEEKLFDLVVTDFNMPVMDGEALIRHIRTNTLQSGIPILMVTSEENKQRLAAVQQAGVSGICDKPFEIETIRRMIGEFCQEP